MKCQQRTIARLFTLVGIDVAVFVLWKVACRRVIVSERRIGREVEKR